MKMVPIWVLDFIEANTDTEDEAEYLYDFADCLINDEGIEGESLMMLLVDELEIAF